MAIQHANASIIYVKSRQESRRKPLEVVIECAIRIPSGSDPIPAGSRSLQGSIDRKGNRGGAGVVTEL
jgi:hypothetical protein